VAAQQLGQRSDAFPILAAIGRVFDARHPLGGQHDTGKLAEFGADLGFGEGLLKIAALTVAGPRYLPAVGQGHRHSRRPQPRRNGTHRRVFSHLHAVAQCRDNRIVKCGVVELTETGVSSDDHDRGGIEYFEAK